MSCFVGILEARSSFSLARHFGASAALLKGHAKWQNIKNIKAAGDRQKGLVATKQTRLIRLAIQEGGSADPTANAALRKAINESHVLGVRKSTIDATIRKCIETPIRSKMPRHVFEGRLYNKMFLIIAVYTDNLELTRNQLAAIFKKHRFDAKSVRGLFVERGVIDALARPDIKVESIEDECIGDAMECGAENVEIFDAIERKVTFHCDPNEIIRVRQKLATAGHEIAHSECVFESKAPGITLKDAEAKDFEVFKGKLKSFVDGFDEIYTNLEAEDEDSE